MSLYIASVMSVFKPLLKLGTRDVRVEGLAGLMDLLRSEERGVITVANHISVLDDPLAWAAMPFSSYFNTRTVRWTLGAHDILFENPLLAPLFSNGQVIETFRGRGIYQPSLDRAISLLDDSRWIHIFPEGKVNQDESIGRANLELLRFRWGVSRLTMETEKLPYVVPMWLQGFDTIMPENRGFPRPLPRLFPRRSISITFGAPLEPDDPKRLPLLRSYRSKLGTPTLGIPHLPSSRIPKPGRHPDSLNSDTTLARACRIQVAEWLRQEVQRLGTEVRQGTGDGQRGGRRRGFGGPGVETVR